MQGSLPAGGLRLCREGVEPSGSLRKVSDLHALLLSRTYPDASWAHARRKFYEVHQATGSPVAAEALRRIAALYAIEATIRGQTANTRQSARRARSLSLVGVMKTWLETELNRVPPRGGLADATHSTKASARAGLASPPFILRGAAIITNLFFPIWERLVTN
jgi:Transposase IS66 family